MTQTQILTDSASGLLRSLTDGDAPESRALPSWVDAFVQYTNHLPSPRIFRKWSAIAAVAGACERRVWSTVFGMELYPNLFVLLVGGPGSGKTISISQVERLWRGTGALKIASKTMTKAGLIDTLNEAKRVHNPNLPGEPPLEYHSLQIPAPEFGNLVPAYDLPFMNVLNELFDAGDQFSERLRGRGEELLIKNPQITILAGTQPDYLTTLLPEEAWGQGFTSRNILIYSPSPPPHSIRNVATFDRDLRKALEYDLIEMTNLYGQFAWTEDAWAALDEWHLAGGPPAPTHMRLEHYLARRVTHVEKLAMVASVSRSNSLSVTLADFQLGLSWLLEAEAAMPQIFRLISFGGDSAITYDAWQWAQEQYAEHRKPIPEHRLVNFLHQRIEAVNVLRTLETMVKAGLLEVGGMDTKGKNMYIPIVVENTSSTRLTTIDQPHTRLEGAAQPCPPPQISLPTPRSRPTATRSFPLPVPSSTSWLIMDTWTPDEE